MATPLRYPGGKTRLADFIEDLIVANGLRDSHYVEPYAGGAGVALSLLFMEVVSEVHLNDLDRTVFAFWHSVLNHNKELCHRIRATPITVREWERQREVRARAKRAALLDLGFSTFFLNRTNRSGILDGGVIGGKDQTGKWKIDARFNKDQLIERIERVGRFSSRINLYKKDASALLDDVVPELPKKTFLYLDPPYFEKGQELYDNHYEPADHSQIAARVCALDRPWVVSYDNTPEIRRLYRGQRRRLHVLPYSANEHRSGAEVLFFSDGLKIPRQSRGVGQAA